MKFITARKSILWYRILNTIANSIFKLFLPVIIYQQTNSLFYSLIYLLVENGIRFLFIIVLRKQLAKYPILFLSINVALIVIIQTVFVLLPNLNLPFIIILGAVIGISSAFHWIPMNSIFALTSKENTHKSLRNYESLASFAKMIAPLLGGVILYFNNFVLSVAMCVLLYLSSIIMIFLSYPNMKKLFNNSFDNSNKSLLNENKNQIVKLQKKEKTFYNIFFGFIGIRDFSNDQIWPLFLAVNSVNIALVGVVEAILQFGVIISYYVVSSLGSKKKWYYITVVASIISIVIVIIRQFFLNYVSFLTFTLVLGFFVPIIGNVVFAKFIQFSNNTYHAAINMADREACIIGAKLLPCTIILLGAPLSVCFYMAGGCYIAFNYFYYTLFKKEKNEFKKEKVFLKNNKKQNK